MPERGFLDEPDDLPKPPPTPPSQDRPDEPEKPRLVRGVVAVAVLVFAIAAIVGVGYTWLSPPVKPVASESPSEAPPSHAPVNPCAHDTFNSNGCAVRIIENTAQQYDAPPYAVVQAMCKKLTTQAARRALVDKWVSQGARRREARAVLGEFMDYCSRMEDA